MSHEGLKISRTVLEKLETKHQVKLHEVYECVLNRTRGLLEDTREVHQTHPPTRWFIAETDRQRVLKIVLIIQTDGTYEIKTAYVPNETEVKIYEKYA